MPIGRSKFIVLAMLGTAALAWGAVATFHALSGPDPICLRKSPSGRSSADIISACKEHLAEANSKADAAVSRRADSFAEFINSRKPGAEEFAEDLVSLYGKWRALKPYLPFTDGNGHRKYVEERFDEHIFSQEQLATAVRVAVEGTLRDLDGVENELAVALHEEVLGRPLAPDEIPVADAEFQAAIDEIVAASQWDAAKAGQGLVISEVAANVGAQILVRLGVSAGILTSSAATSWWTLGAGVIIGLIVDAIWGWIDDPEGDIQRATVAELDKIATHGAAAIREEMRKAADQKREEWRQAALGTDS